MTPKRGIAPKTVRRRSSSPTGQETKVARLARELNEAVEQQTATSELLSVISRSKFDLQAILQGVLDAAARLCRADKSVIFRLEHGVYRFVAAHGALPAYVEIERATPILPGPGTLVGRTAMSWQVVRIDDVLIDPLYEKKGDARIGGFRSAIGVPLMRENEPIGVLGLSRSQVEPFSDRETELTMTFADQAAIAIEHARFFEAEQQRTRELTELLEQQTATSEVLQVISSYPGDVQPVFETMLEKAVRICDAKFGNIFRWDRDALALVATHNIPPAFAELRRRLPFRPGPDNPIGRMVATKAVVHVADLAAERRYVERRDPAMIAAVELGGVRSFVAVPMLKEGELIGALIVYRQEVRPFTDKQIVLVQNFAAQGVIAIENARLLTELRQRTDDLTESLEQQTATSEVLQVISSSPRDLQPVFEAILESATRICEAKFGVLMLAEGDAFQLGAVHNAPQAFADFMQRGPVRPSPHITFGRAVATKRVAQTADITIEQPYLQGDPLAVAAAELGGYRTVLAVPMLKESEIIGALVFFRQEVRPFNDKQIALVQNFASQAIIAVENVRLFEAEQERTRELTESLEQQTATSKVLDVISRSAFDLRAVFNTVAESSVRLCGSDRAIFYRFDGGLLRMAAGFNVSRELTEFVERTPIHPGRSSASARAALERRTVHVHDCMADPEYSWGGKYVDPVRRVLAVPILKGDDLLGMIVVYHLEVRPFTEKQIALVETFADQSAIAIENARLLDELRQRTNELGRSVEELRALGDVSQAVNSTLELETVLSTIVAKAVQLSGTEAGAIYVFDDLQREFQLRATYGMDQELIEALTHQRIGLDEPNVVQALAQGEPVQVADLREGAPSAASEVIQVIQRAGFRALLVAPLLRGEDVVGMLVVRRKTPGAFPQNTVDLIKTFAAQSVLAIQNARLFDSVETRTRELAKSLGDLRTAQDRLVQTEKLASLGQLTAGIAHEIKNPLNFVNNFSSVSVELIDELRDALGGAHLDNKLRAEIGEIADTLQGNLDKVVQHGKRADAIVKNMLLHSRQGSGEHRPVDINALVDESLNLAYHGARAERQGFNITLERSFDPAAGDVDLFPQEITRALLNLISNGFYAASKRKAEANGGDYEPTLSAATKNLGDSVEIQIRDNGTGIPPEVREKLFSPFFTTKPAGEGTGLGLSISHDIIVKQHGGSIEVDTKPGDFTEFRIVLPRAGASLIKSGERTRQ